MAKLHDWRYVDGNKLNWHLAEQICTRCGAIRYYNGLDHKWQPASNKDGNLQRYCTV